MNRGIHHIGLATHDMEGTLDFYEKVLGFPAVVCEMIEPENGGAIRHAFFDVGDGELIAFMEANDVEGVARDFDAGINRGLGTGAGMIHFAFKVADPTELAEKRDELAGKGISVRGIVDHGWCQSIYFRDPNFVQLEFCCLTTELGSEHTAGRHKDGWKRYARR
ncbi:MAG: VOC family protein [Deltaproteobacteria bacterium]|nr:VOC family protein [Deltaproteobacteria bacterium]MBW2723718.1 VOC family protein [Deltaproteobacteria bacterium]